jgi:multidrug resistance efflux pump
VSDYCWDMAHGDDIGPKSECVGCLRERIAELDKEYRAAMENLNERDAVIDQQQAELERLREALKRIARLSVIEHHLSDATGIADDILEKVER